MSQLQLKALSHARLKLFKFNLADIIPLIGEELSALEIAQKEGAQVLHCLNEALMEKEASLNEVQDWITTVIQDIEKHL
jgi:predicted metal-dependent phosphoesterase TrpH